MTTKSTVYPDTGIFRTKIIRQLGLPLLGVDDPLEVLELLGPVSKDPLRIDQTESEVTEFLKAFVKKNKLSRRCRKGGPEAASGWIEHAFQKGVDKDRNITKQLKGLKVDRKQLQESEPAADARHTCCHSGRFLGIELTKLLPPSWIQEVQQHVDKVRDQIAKQLKEELKIEKSRSLVRQLQEIERAHDACRILSLIPSIRLIYRTGDQYSKRDIKQAFAFGKICERFSVRPAEQAALTGRKILAAASAGGRMEKQRAAERNSAIARRFHESGLSRRVFSRIHDIPFSTLKRIVKKSGSPPAE